MTDKTKTTEDEDFLSSINKMKWQPEPISEFEHGVRQAARVAKAAYMLRHNDGIAAQLLHDVILAPLVKRDDN